jgi:hypothetical protein
MPAIDLSILNQRQTPAFYADTLANRPAAGFVGRIFVSTDTLDLYRDTGSAWVLLSPSSTGTVTGTGATGQVTYWASAGSITGSNDLFFDSVNGHLGIGTVTPGTALDVKHDQSTVVQLEQVTATNDIRIAFINSGVGLWRLGAFYNAGANDFGLFDIAAATQPVTVKRTTGQVLIGTSTVGSGKLVVASSTGDNGVQIVGAAAPSLRIDNAESGPTKRAGFGISTATNNFIQGSADRDFCMFNGSTTASPILFGIYGTTNVLEAARISAARNFLIGTTTDGGYKLNVNGTGYINDRLTIDGTGTGQYIQFYNSGADRAHIYWDQVGNALSLGTYIAGGSISFETGNNVDAMLLNSSGNLGLGVTPSAWTSIDKAIEIAKVGNSIFSGGINDTTLTGNAYFSTGWKYGANGAANLFSVGYSSNSFVWLSATTGTAGNAISFSQPMTLTSSSNLLIGTITDAGQKLQVAGAVNSNGANSGYLYEDRTTGVQWELYASAGTARFFNNAAGIVANIVQATGVYIATSDRNKKKNFEQSNLGLDAILKLKPTLYNMISQKDNEAKELGFIAQEVKEVIEQAYVENLDFIGLNYQPIVATLVKAIQELNAKIENIK